MYKGIETPLTLLKKSGLSNKSINKIMKSWTEKDLNDRAKIDGMKEAIDFELTNLYHMEPTPLKTEAAAEAFALLTDEYITWYIANHGWKITEENKSDFNNSLDGFLAKLETLSDDEILATIKTQNIQDIDKYAEINEVNSRTLKLYFQAQDLLNDFEPEKNNESKINIPDLSDLLDKLYKHNLALEAEDLIIEKHLTEKGWDEILSTTDEDEYDNYVNEIENMSDEEKLHIVENYDLNEVREYGINHALVMDYLENKFALNEAETILDNSQKANSDLTEEKDSLIAEAEDILNSNYDNNQGHHR